MHQKTRSRPGRAVSGESLPTFFVIGSPKSGTTSIHHYLDRHPEISMSVIKEPAFFSDGNPGSLFEDLSQPESYVRLFDPSAPARGESSASYASWPEQQGVPEAIHSQVPKALFVYVVRDPIDRVESFVRQALSLRFEPFRSLPEGVTPDELLSEGSQFFTWLTCPGLYMTQIRQYLQFFPADALLVVDSDELDRDTQKVMARVFRHIGVADDLELDGFDLRLNQGHSKRRVSDLYLRLSEFEILRSVLRRLPVHWRQEALMIFRDALSGPLKIESLGPETRGRLEELYRPEVEELRSFTGQKFPNWSI